MAFKNAKSHIKYFGHDLDRGDYTPHLYISATQDTLEVKVYRPADATHPEHINLWHKLKLSDLKAVKGFEDQTLWAFPHDLTPVDVDGVTQANKLTGGTIIDVFARSVSSKNIGQVNGDFLYTPYVIYVGDSTGDFTTFTIIVKSVDSTEFILEGPHVNEIKAAANINTVAEIIPHITLSSDQTTVAPDSSIEVNVTADVSIKEVFLEQVYGAPNKLRVPLTNGTGSFRVYTTGMVVGETLRIKAGYRKYTGVSDFTATIS